MSLLPLPRRGSASRRRPGPRGPGLGPPLERYLRRRAWRAGAGAVIALALLVGLMLADRRGWLLHDGGDLARYDGRTFRVVKVVDGDTLDVEARDGRHAATRIRLWGVDTPEMRVGEEGGPQPYAIQATDLTRQLALDQPVRLILEPARLRDRYDRLLAHVELPGGRLLSEELLAAGLARADARWEHRHQDRFARLEEQARHDGVGLWTETPPGPEPP